MPQQAVVAAMLWDLRVQCEQQLRAISTAQGLINRYREGGDIQASARHGLLDAVATVVEAQDVIAVVVTDCRRAILALPNGGPHRPHPSPRQ